MKKLFLLLLVLSSISCSTTKTLKFSQKQDEIVKTESLKSFLLKNKNPKVVLRVKQTSQSVTDKENNDYLYNAIENQLLTSGFIVRDRQLFNQIIGNNDNTIDYEKLKEKSDTDLIIELTKLDPEIPYQTNKYYDNKNKEKVDEEFMHKRYGASIEFKIVLIGSNEFAGVYKFNYTPCVDGCVLSKSIAELNKELKKKNALKVKAYEGVSSDELELFMKDATIKLVTEMRK